MGLVDTRDDLQEAANTRALRKSLRATAIAGIIFGALALSSGLPSDTYTPFVRAAYVGLGVFLLAQGMWNILLPRPAGIIVSGTAIVAIGLWNIISTVQWLGTNPSSSKFWIIFGFFQLYWGIRRAKSYSVFHTLSYGKPSQETIKWLDSLAKRILEGQRKGAADVIAIVRMGTGVWTGVLSGEEAVFLHMPFDRLIFVRKDDVEITRQGGTDKMPQVQFRIGGYSGVGKLMSDKRLPIYEAWKNPSVAQTSIEAKSPPIGLGFPAPASQPQAATSETAVPITYAGFWHRFAAFAIDSALIGVVTALILTVFSMAVAIFSSSTRGGSPSDAFFTAVGFITFLTAAVPGWLYFSIMESSSKQATLGKMALGIRVTDIAGGRLSFRKASGRHFGKIISAVIVLLGFVMAAFTQKKQALHDLIAGTLVMDRRA